MIFVHECTVEAVVKDYKKACKNFIKLEEIRRNDCIDSLKKLTNKKRTFFEILFDSKYFNSQVEGLNNYIDEYQTNINNAYSAFVNLDYINEDDTVMVRLETYSFIRQYIDR